MDDNTMYLLFADGSFRSIEMYGPNGTRQTVPEGATEITRAEFEELVRQMEEAEAQRQAEQEAAAEAARLAEYLDLRAAGFPHSSAARISGYTGPEINP